MNTSQLLPSVAFTLAALASPAVALGGAVCPAESHCYLPRWVPAEAMGNETYGRNVEIDGSTAAISGRDGAPIAIYERVGNTWVETQSLPNPSGLSGDLYGWSLSLQGDRLAVGAPKDNTFALDSGAVHLFERTGGLWTYDETVYDFTPDSNELFGQHVDLDGQWLGVANYDGWVATSVRAYLNLPGGWIHYAQIGSYAPGAGSLSVEVHELEGGLSAQFFIGIPNSDLQASGAGQVDFVSISQIGIHTQTVPAPPLNVSDKYGTSLAYDGTRLVVGSPLDDEAAANAGAAYVFDVGPDPVAPIITLDEKLLPCGDVISSHFGGSVDVLDGRVAVGAQSQDTKVLNSGAAYVFGVNAFGTWSIHDRVTAHDGTTSSLFGGNVALTESAILIGAELEDAAGEQSGAAYFVSLNPDSVEGGECPCESLARNQAYGEGKPGSDGVPELVATEAPVPGESTLIKLTDVLVGATPFLFWGTVPAAIPFDEGTFLVGDVNFEVMPTVGVLGQVGMLWQVPASPAFCGMDIFTQALLLDPSAGGQFSTAQSNGLHLTIGY